MATLVNLTINGYDIVGSNFDPNRASAYLTPNTPHGLIVVDGASIRLGGKRVKFGTDGQIIYGGLVATNSADNPTSFAYRVTIVYTPIGARKQEEWTSSDFTLTTSLNLANISEAFDGLAIAPTWQSDFRDEMEAIAGLTGEDAAIANRINTAGSATETALDAKISARTNTVNAAKYGTLSTNFSTAVQAAVNAVPDGGTVIIPAGDYTSTATITNLVGGVRKSVRVVGYGAKIMSEGLRIFDFRADYETIYNVSGTPTQVAATSSDRVASVTATLTAAPSGWSKGDVVRIVADDAIPETRPVSGGLVVRSGQFLAIESASGTSITFRGLLRDAYTTNVRVARLPKVTAVIEGLEVGYTAAAIASHTSDSTLIGYTNLTGPAVRNVTVGRGLGPAVAVAGCYGYEVDNLDVGWLSPGDVSDPEYGYGVMDSSSYAGRVTNSRFRRVRHGFTTAAPSVAANSTGLGFYGRSYGGKITDCSADSPHGTAFDTHADAEGFTFQNCTVTNAMIGFGLRGKGNRVIDCNVEDSYYGLWVFDEVEGTQSWGHFVDGLRIVRPGRCGILVDRNPAGHPTAGTLDTRIAARLHRVTIVEADADSSLSHAIQVNNGTVSLNDLRVSLRPGTTADGSIIQLRHSIVRDSKNWVVDVSRHSTWDGTGGAPTENNLHVFECYNDGSPLDQEGGTVRNKILVSDISVTGRSFTLADAVRGSGAGDLVQLRRMEFDIRPSGGSIVPATCVDGSYCEFRAPGKNASDNNGAGSAFLYASSSTGTLPSTIPAAITLRIDPVIYVQIVVVTTAATLPALPVGRYLGQELVIMNRGSVNLTVQHGGNAALTGSANVVLAGGQTMRLAWLVNGAGRAWVQIA